MKIEKDHSGADTDRILQYLKHQPDAFVAAAEIARFAAGQARYFDDPRWAGHILSELRERALVECDGHDGYRFKSPPAVTCDKKRRFIAPQLRDILERNHQKLAWPFDVQDNFLRDSLS